MKQFLRDNGLPLGVLAIGQAWCWSVGGFWCSVGTILITMVYWILCFRHDLKSDESMIMLGMIFFGFTWCGYGYVFGTLGWWWAVPITVVLIHAFVLAMEYYP
jgi:hypothetical protein